jgi:YggT family protein
MLPIYELIHAILEVYKWLVIVSMILSWLAAFGVVNTRNQAIYTIGKTLHALTEPALRPIRRLLPNFAGIDIAPLVLVIVIWFVQLEIEFALMLRPGNYLLPIYILVDFMLDLCKWLLIISAIVSWLVAFNVINMRNPIIHAIGRTLYALTDPMLRPIRRILPNLGGIDISPLIVILIIWFLQMELSRNVLPHILGLQAATGALFWGVLASAEQTRPQAPGQHAG